MTQARLTIGIPTRNRAGSVTQLIEACLNQTELPFEIIVSDNASDDDTMQRLAAFSSPCLRVIRQEKNIGMVPNWNTCLDAARGDFFVLISDDDMIDKDFVESVCDLLGVIPAADLAIVRCRITDDVIGETSSNPPPVLQAGEIDFVDCILPKWLNSRFFIPLAGVVFRTSALRASGGFVKDWPFAADAATWLPFAMHGKCVFLPEAKATYLVHDGATTAAIRSNSLIEDTAKLVTLINRELAKCAEIDPETRETIRQMSVSFLGNSFAYFMIRAARAGASKREILDIWRVWGHRLPWFGISPMSLGALLVPRALIPWVGAPYRWWVRQRRGD